MFIANGLHETFGGRLGEDTCATAMRRLGRWWTRCEATVGPATSVRTIVEASGEGLFDILGLHLSDLSIQESGVRATARAVSRDGAVVPVLVCPWAEDLDRSWRESVLVARGLGAAWCYAWNVRELRLVDAVRPWGRRFVSFDLAACLSDPAAFSVLWGLARAEAVVRPGRGFARSRPGATPRGTLLEEIVAAAARAGQLVCAGLERGVDMALVRLAGALASACGRHIKADADALFDQSLTVIYRLLFLLFAEARSLVPTWHATYRDSYSVGALRDVIEVRPDEPGLWSAIQAVSRLAREGCRVGDLRVTPFNGHLFASARAPLAEHARVDDAVLRDVLVSLTTATVSRRRVRISFADLGVEQLGAIYERILDHRLVVEDAPLPGSRQRPARPCARLVGDRRQRKISATYYTPRSLTDFLVRRTLAPLVRAAGTEEILRLRVLDPAMGSGAFLVAACQYLARAYEHAVLREQDLRAHEITEADRAGFRRLVARHCLYGVDKNPMAVQLARLSLWLATLAADVPLTFLDHHLRLGDSLLGAALDDLLRQAPGLPRGRLPARLDALPLLVATEAWQAIGRTVPTRLELAATPDDTLEQVRQKERVLAALEGDAAALARWRRVADLWCAVWFWRGSHPAPQGAVYADLVATLLDRQGSLPARLSAPLLAEAEAIAREERFFHWTLEFPEVFWATSTSRASSAPGFDAVFGNPPWAVVRDEPAGGTARPRAHARFVREAGVYAGSTDAHVNLYLLFVERALHLLRPGGRIGFVVPWGLAADHGAAGVRQGLFDRCRLDSWLALDNRRGLFPVHRSLRFLAFTGSSGEPTTSLPLRQEAGDPAVLDACPEHPDQETSPPLRVTRSLLALVSPGSQAVPDVRRAEELRLLARLWQLAPPLASPGGWGVHFGRELNASDDRDVLRDAPPGFPVIEGKHLGPFRAQVERASRFVREADAVRRLPARPFAAERIAYRDVASASNQRTLIAAVIAPGTVTTHTVFCSRGPQATRLHLLCALLNSVVANWLVRRWVSTHVTVALVERLPVPTPQALDPWADDLEEVAVALAREPDTDRAVRLEARLQGTAAAAWGLTRDELEVVLQDMPLLPAPLVSGARAVFDRLAPAGTSRR
jgi:hypothetical protein